MHTGNHLINSSLFKSMHRDDYIHKMILGNIELYTKLNNIYTNSSFNISSKRQGSLLKLYGLFYFCNISIITSFIPWKGMYTQILIFKYIDNQNKIVPMSIINEKHTKYSYTCPFSYSIHFGKCSKLTKHTKQSHSSDIIK